MKNKEDTHLYSQSRRDFLKKVTALGTAAICSGLFLGEKEMQAANKIMGTASGKCSSSYDCAGGGGDCGSSYNCAGGGGKCGSSYDCSGQGSGGEGKCSSSYDCVGGGGKCNVAGAVDVEPVAERAVGLGRHVPHTGDVGITAGCVCQHHVAGIGDLQRVVSIKMVVTVQLPDAAGGKGHVPHACGSARSGAISRSPQIY